MTAKPNGGIAIPPEAELLADLELCISRHEDGLPGKSIASQDGWTFLAKDTSDYLRWQFGIKRWDQAQLDKANAALKSRVKQIKERNGDYFFFVIPEKSAAYSEYLPGVLKHIPAYDGRPATALHSSPDNQAYYLLQSIQQFKKISQVYFRGDSHPSWVGSFLIYRAIHAAVSRLVALSPPLTINDLSFAAGAYRGDLYAQLSETFFADRPELFSIIGTEATCEHNVRVGLKEQSRAAKPAPVDAEYAHLTSTREAFVWNNSNQDLPRCVIFRDSTSQYFLEYLAEHFSRTVAIWHGGHVIEEVLARERPDVVLHIQAERFIFTLPHARPIVSLPAPQADAATQ